MAAQGIGIKYKVADLLDNLQAQSIVDCLNTSISVYLQPLSSSPFFGLCTCSLVAFPWNGAGENRNPFIYLFLIMGSTGEDVSLIYKYYTNHILSYTEYVIEYW